MTNNLLLNSYDLFYEEEIPLIGDSGVSKKIRISVFRD